MRRSLFLPLTLTLLLPAGCAPTAPPKPDLADLPAYLGALNRSADPKAQVIRARIAHGPADLARERAAADKDGLLTRPEQLQAALPPADQNAAPLYTRLFALRKQKPLQLPLYAQPLSGRTAYTSAQLAVVQREVDTRADIFTLLHQAADQPQCVFVRGPLDFLGFPSKYAGLRESAREIKTESFLLASRGSYSEAVTNQERGFSIARHTTEPRLISYLVGVAIEAITIDGMQTILAKAGPDAVLDRRVEADLLALPPLSLHHALSGEGVFGIWEFDQMKKAKPSELAQALPSGSPFVGKRTASTSARFTPTEQTQVSNLLDAAAADYLHQLGQLVAAADSPKSVRDTAFARVKIRAMANQDDPIEAYSDLLNPFIAGETAAAPTLSFAQNTDRSAARRLVTAAGASVLAEKARTSVYPDALPAGFTDPFTGKPLGYHLEGTDGFVIYSAGPTGTFDGGKAGEKVPAQESVFRYPAVPEPTPGTSAGPSRSGKG